MPRQNLRLLASALASTFAFVSIGGQPVQAAPQPTDDVLARPSRGPAAIDALGARLPDVAAQNRLSASELVSLLRSDKTMWLDPKGRLHVKDEFIPKAAPAGTSEEAPYPNQQTFSLHSNPGAARTIHLDFDGHEVTGTSWNASYGVVTTQPAFDIDGNPANWSQGEHDAIQSVFQRVSEDFAPFDVDVTTEDPGDAALQRSSSTDDAYGTRVLITPSVDAHNKICGGCGGVAYIGVFNSASSGYYQPAWVFPHQLSNNAKYIAEAASHEAGHNLGLNHDGTAATGYYTGHGNWAPIMGVGYYEPLVQWSRGEYPGANNTQDDFSVAQGYGLPLRSDDHGSTMTAPRALGTSPSVAGGIDTAADVDIFSIDRTCTAATTIDLTTALNSPNLDAKLTLRDSGGGLIAVSDPQSEQLTYDVPTGLAASISAQLSSGSYYLEVEGVGAGDLTSGYSDYGSVGRYTLSISECSTARFFDLTVGKAGTGTGTVTSTPEGINCGFTCSAAYFDGASVSLAAVPAPGSTFAGWSGACAGTGVCSVSMTAARSVTATFNTGPSCSLRGTSGNDVLTGTSGNDIICGLEGNDTIKGQGGNDTIIGGPGTDKVDFANATTAVTANLTTGTATGQGSDTLTEIEGVDGSPYADTIDGDVNANQLAGKAGNDKVYGQGGNDNVWGGDGTDTVAGGDGNDRIDGGNGVDTATFGLAVNADLTAGTATGQGTDMLVLLENIKGSPGNDRLRGSATVNRLEGGDGVDTLLGEGGNDGLFGQAGNDSLTGGLGTDNCDGGLGTDTNTTCETRVGFP